MKVYRIYKCTNQINGKTYIGFTNKPLIKRIIEHKSSAKSGSDYLLHKAIRKYGIDSFNWECLYESFDREFILSTMENHFIMENNSYFEDGFGYNMTFGGQGGMLGKKHNDDSKEKMSLTKLQNPNTKVQASLAGKISAQKRKEDPNYKVEQSKRIKEWWASRKGIGV